GAGANRRESNQDTQQRAHHYRQTGDRAIIQPGEAMGVKRRNLVAGDQSPCRQQEHNAENRRDQVTGATTAQLHDSTARASAVAGMLPVASSPIMRHSIVWLKPWTILPTVLVAAAKRRSVPTAVAGETPNSTIRTGVNSDPPPTPVAPMRAPTRKPTIV